MGTGRWAPETVFIEAAALLVGLVVISACGQSTERAALKQPTSIVASTSTSLVGATRSELPLAPSPRIGASMAFDPLSKSVVLFGGLGPYGSLADTWSWDGERWHALHPPVRAPSRTDAAMTYDPVSGDVLMLSGEELVPLTDPCQRPAGRPPVCTPEGEERDVSPGAELWGWDGHGWHLRLRANISPHPQGGIVTEPDGNVLALAANGTWTYDGSVWQLRAPTSGVLTAPVGIAVDPTSHQVIAVERYQPGICMPHSGCQHPAYMRTFTWTGHTWKALADKNTPLAPNGAVTQAALVADSAGGGLLMLADDHSTWRRSANGRWQQVATAAQSPPALDEMTLVADPAHREIVGFGGEAPRRNVADFTPTNDTWVWNGSRWRELTAPVSPSPTPPPPAPANCGLNGPSLGGNQQPTHDATVRVVANNLFLLAPCHLQATLTLTLRGPNGQPLAVAGNPSTVNIDTNAPEHAQVLSATWTWTHPCAATAVHADVQATGAGAFPTPFPIDLTPLPACHGTTTSTLNAAPYTIAAPG